MLKEEEEHKERHLRGVCFCEVVFDGEEREKRQRSRVEKGKAKAVKTGDVGQGGGSSGDHTVDEEQTVINVYGSAEAGPSYPQQGWESELQAAAYEYVRYPIGRGQVQVTASEQASAHVQPQYTAWGGKLSAGQDGAGMKWYPQEHLPLLPPLPLHLRDNPVRTPPRYVPKARSEPTEKGSDETLVELEISEASRQPMVISSDMARPEST